MQTQWHGNQTPGPDPPAARSARSPHNICKHRTDCKRAGRLAPKESALGGARQSAAVPQPGLGRPGRGTRPASVTSSVARPSPTVRVTRLGPATARVPVPAKYPCSHAAFGQLPGPLLPAALSFSIPLIPSSLETRCPGHSMHRAYYLWRLKDVFMCRLQVSIRQLLLMGNLQYLPPGGHEDSELLTLGEVSCHTGRTLKQPQE
uniref:uncharacterized protein LOC110597677 n=1 Tax=Ictidomys tridecemlineatus TaxID=43179 RepID=UPI001A9D4F54|nr:uncharacterized protein LOC110597677 [Ictidomys tridecemlineatus]